MKKVTEQKNKSNLISGRKTAVAVINQSKAFIVIGKTSRGYKCGTVGITSDLMGCFHNLREVEERFASSAVKNLLSGLAGIKKSAVTK